MRFALYLLLAVSTSALKIHTASLQQKDNPDGRWPEEKIVEYMTAHPQRAYFSRFFLDGGFRTGMEVGVADGRNSEYFIREMNSMKGTQFTWHLVEPFPNTALLSRLPEASFGVGPHGAKRVPMPHRRQEVNQTWAQQGLAENVEMKYHKTYSTDKAFLDSVPDHSLDFVYLDGGHRYKEVKEELQTMLVKMSPGAVLAGHDYCNYGEPGLECNGCDHVPRCGTYTEYGEGTGRKSVGADVDNQAEVVQAVHEFAQAHPELRLYHTLEDFTRETLAEDGIDYDQVITSTRNPSWFFVLTK